jgi:signal transduction histidine kinase
MVVQASLGAELVRADPARAAAAVEEVERVGRAALERTGGLLRLIREGAPDTHPQHGAADLPALVAEYDRAGLEVELDGAELEHVPAGVDASVYRIVQEALTNALKHAPGSRVRIRIAQSPTDLVVEVVNTAPGDERRARVPSGHGLTGLRERVGLYGGRLDARPTPGGGFLLAASMPVTGER